MEKQSVTLKESQERVDRFISQFEEGLFFSTFYDG